ncbi:35_t:CDS:2, partial [Acaulospora colombiana]
LLDFLHDNNPSVRHLALERLLGYTVKSSQFQHIFRRNGMRPIKDLKFLCKDEPVIAHEAFKALVNLTGEDDIREELNDDDFLKFLIKIITDRHSILADMACMLLSNITKNERISEKILPMESQSVKGLSSSKRSIDHLVDLFVNGLDRSYNQEAEFHFLASVFANMTMDMEGMPEDIQLLPSDKKREPDAHLRQILLESLVLLTTTRSGREILREKKVYPVVRQMHLAEKDDRLSNVIDQIVNMLMRDDAPEEHHDAAPSSGGCLNSQKNMHDNDNVIEEL